MNQNIRKMTVSKLIECLNAHQVGAELIQGSPNTVFTGITADSRKIQGGELFIAVRGSHTDGHLFIYDAVSKGATVIAVQHDNGHELDVAPWVTVIETGDTQKMLALAASAFYGFPTEKLYLIGVTGTNGKTTTTILIEAILREAGFEAGRIGTIGYCWKEKTFSASLTTPDPIMLQHLFAEMVNDGVTHVVMEVSSHALHQKRIFGYSYDVGVFTNLSHDHLDFHKTMEDYFRAKSLLFLEHLKSNTPDHPKKRRGCAVINIDDPYGRQLLDNLKGKDIEIITYSLHNPSSSIYALSYRCSPDGTFIRVKTSEGEIPIVTKLLGHLNIYNILASIGAGIAAEIDLQKISKGIASVAGVDGRLQKVPIEAPFHVIVDYAHTPDAMDKALSCIREWTSGRVIAVFGCGGDRDPMKRPLMAQVAAKHSDVVIITSDNPRTENPEKIIEDILKGIPADWSQNILNENPQGKPSLKDRKILYVISDRREAIKTSLQIAKPGDVIFIGGKGHETYQIIGLEKFPFDDRCVVRECYDTICKTSQ